LLTWQYCSEHHRSHVRNNSKSASMVLPVGKVLVGAGVVTTAAAWAVKHHVNTLVSCQQHLSVRAEGIAHDKIAYKLLHMLLYCREGAGGPRWMHPRHRQMCRCSATA
jgi:hypothetical protein